MNKKTKNNNEPVGKLTKVKDFLPPPSELVAKEDNARITLALSRESIEFFKHEAKENNVPYQRMIRAALDEYAHLHTKG